MHMPIVAFEFELAIDGLEGVELGAEGAEILFDFRQFSGRAQNIGESNLPGSLNIGFRIMRRVDGSILHEDRAILQRTKCESGQSVQARIIIGPAVVKPDVIYSIMIDLVFEEMFWFHEMGSVLFESDMYFLKPIPTRQIESIQSSTLGSLLESARRRINELETHERSLLANIAELKVKLKSLSDLDRGKLSTKMWLSEAVSIDRASLSIVQMRDVYLDLANRYGLPAEFFALMPHGRAGTDTRILVVGSGGYGDMIYLTTVVRELYRSYPKSYIFIMHEHKGLSEVFENNPYVSGYTSVSGSRTSALLTHLYDLQIFDLFVDVRYAVSYALPLNSRIDPFLIEQASVLSAEWQQYVRHSWPYLNNVLAKKATAQGLCKLDLVGKTSMLPISQRSLLDFFITGNGIKSIQTLNGRRFICLHHGADPKMAAIDQLQTKNLPIRYWVELIKLFRGSAELHATSFVQLGSKNEQSIEGVDFDLRGQTSLAETAYVLKHAEMLIDSEGGLVHLARAVQTPSIVLFGPTSSDFFGYPANVNIKPQACGDCWWTTLDWSANCPRGLRVPECMEKHDPLVCCAAARDIIGVSDVTLTHKASMIIESLSQLNSILKTELMHNPDVIVFGELADANAVKSSVLGDYSNEMILPSYLFRQIHQEVLARRNTLAYSTGNVPIATASHKSVLAFGFDLRNSDGINDLFDVARGIVKGGCLRVVATNRLHQLPIRDWEAHINNSSRGLLGGKYHFPGISLQGFDFTSSALGLVLEFEVQQV